MTTDDRRPDVARQPGSAEGDPRLEADIRAALEGEASRIRPADRLSDILAEAHSTSRSADHLVAPRAPQPRWGLAAAAAAAVLAIVGGALWLTGRTAPDPSASRRAGVTTATTSPAPATSPPAGPSTPAATSSTQPSGTIAPPLPGDVQALPVYYVGPRLLTGSEGAAGALFREFVRASVPTPATPEARARVAVDLAMGATPAGSTYERLWAGVTLVDLDVGEADRITIRLSGPASVSQADAELAVQQLVWTAQAAAAQGNVPVRFELVDGSDTVAGTLPASRDFVRPSDELEVSSLLAPLWIDDPARGQVLPADRAVTVTGQASTFEASLSWQLLRGETVLHEGFTTASAGAPARGEFTFTVPALPAGSYTIRVFEVSLEDGSDRAEQRIPFSVE